jgi:hypothetical protein
MHFVVRICICISNATFCVPRVIAATRQISGPVIRVGYRRAFMICAVVVI